MGHYKVLLEARKDVGQAEPTENLKFAVYVSKRLRQIESVLRTKPISLGDAIEFSFTPQGTGLEDIVWSISRDNGQTWVEVQTGTLLPADGASEILLKADLKILEGHEPPVVTGIDWVFVAERETSERYTFTGKERDAMGLYYFGARYYDPEVGRWTTVDPLRVGNNWYKYCYSNPLRFIDQTGKWPGETMHNKETVKIAYAMGFNLADAIIIGMWCKSVDYQLGTLPFPVIGDLSWHFDINKNPNIDTRIVHLQCLALAKQAIDKGDKDEALKWIGMGLHAVQDISAHANFYPLQDPYFHPEDYDNPYLDFDLNGTKQDFSGDLYQAEIDIINF